MECISNSDMEPNILYRFLVTVVRVQDSNSQLLASYDNVELIKKEKFSAFGSYTDN